MPIDWKRAKDPDEVVDYQGDWSDDMAAMEDDTIVASVWLISDPALIEDAATHTDTTTTIWLSGGVEGAKYSLVNRITTAGGRTLDQTFRLAIKTR